MKSLLLSFAILLIATSNSGLFAQSTKNKQVEKIGSLFCECIDKFMDDLHPQLKKFVLEIDEFGQEFAEQQLGLFVEQNPSEAEAIMASANRMADFENSIAELKGCEKMNQLSNEAEAENLNFQIEMEEYFRTSNKCEMAYIFYKLGSEEEEEVEYEELEEGE